MTAFYYKFRPKEDTVVMPWHGVLLDGSTPNGGQVMRCGSCGKSVWLNELKPEGGFQTGKIRDGT